MSTSTHPVLSPVFRYTDAPAAIGWLTRAFGFELNSQHRTPDGFVAHADLRLGASAIGLSSMTASPSDSPWAGVRQGMYLCVSDPDARYDRARAAGADIAIPIMDLDYGSRDFSLRDPEGHLWAFGTYSLGGDAGEPSAWPEVRYRDPKSAIEWLENALGFRRTTVIADDAGGIQHAELRLGRSVFMLGGLLGNAGPGGNPQGTNLRVDDPDAHAARAREGGAVIVREPQTTPYGARCYAARDPEGFVWWVSDYRPVG